MNGYKRITWRTADGVTHLTVWFPKAWRKKHRAHIAYCFHGETREGRCLDGDIVTCLACLIAAPRG